MSIQNKAVVAFVNTLIQIAAENNIKIGHLKLQKLLYLCYGAHVRDYDKEIVSVTFYAWRLGPVIREVYHDFKKFGDAEINTLCVFTDDNEAYLFSEETSKKEINTITTVIKEHGHKSVFELVNLLHKPEGAWDKVYNALIGDVKLKYDDIKEEFSV